MSDGLNGGRKTALVLEAYVKPEEIVEVSETVLAVGPHRWLVVEEAEAVPDDARDHVGSDWRTQVVVVDGGARYTYRLHRLP